MPRLHRNTQLLRSAEQRTCCPAGIDGLGSDRIKTCGCMCSHRKSWLNMPHWNVLPKTHEAVHASEFHKNMSDRRLLLATTSINNESLRLLSEPF